METIMKRAAVLSMTYLALGVPVWGQESSGGGAKQRAAGTAFFAEAGMEFPGERGNLFSNGGPSEGRGPLQKGLVATLRTGMGKPPTGEEMEKVIERIRWRVPGTSTLLARANLRSYVPAGNEAFITMHVFIWDAGGEDVSQSDEFDAKVGPTLESGLQALMDQAWQEAGKTDEERKAKLDRLSLPQVEEGWKQWPDEAMVSEELARLRKEKTDLEIESRGKAARRKALQEGIDQARTSFEQSGGTDARREYEAATRRVAELDQNVRNGENALEDMQRTINPQNSAYLSLKGKTDSWKIKLAEEKVRQEQLSKKISEVGSAPSPGLLQKLADELQMVAIDETQLAIQLAENAKRMAMVEEERKERMVMLQKIDKKESERRSSLVEKVLLQLKAVKLPQVKPPAAPELEDAKPRN